MQLYTLKVCGASIKNVKITECIQTPLLFSQAIIASFSVYAFADEKRIHKKPPFNSERLFETFCPFLNAAYPLIRIFGDSLSLQSKSNVRACANLCEFPRSSAV